MYLVIEIQTYADQTVGTIVNSFSDLNQAEAAYHTCLAAAAVSQVPVHGAVMLQNDGIMIQYKTYTHGEDE